MGTNEATLIYGYYFVLQNSCKSFNSNFFLPTPSLTEFENFPAKSESIVPITWSRELSSSVKLDEILFLMLFWSTVAFVKANSVNSSGFSLLYVPF